METVMKRNPYYALEMINGVPYLLPFGQNVADTRRSFMLNETGVFLWNHMEDAENDEALLDLLLHDESLTIEEDQDIRAELEAFLQILRDNQIIISEAVNDLPAVGRYSIAGIIIELRGMTDYIPKQLKPFETLDNAVPDLSVNIIIGKDGLHSGETILIHDRELNVYESPEFWHLEFPTFDNIESVMIDKYLKRAVIRIQYEEERAVLRENLFHVLRHVFLLKAQSLGFFAIHSASLLYRGKAYLFSGSSGTGKSTHTRLWSSLFDIALLNGDLNLLSDEGIVHGMPWCGTSGIITTKEYPLGGIIFLKQAKENTVEELSGHEKSLRVSNRLISPVYTREQLEENLSFSVNLAKRIPMWSLRCTKEPEAAQLMKQTIDQYLNRSVR